MIPVPVVFRPAFPRRFGRVVCLVYFMAFAAGQNGTTDLTINRSGEGEKPMTMTITSTAFSHHGIIPEKFTCDGRNVSPPLAWQGLPAGTESLVLIVDDSDAPDPQHPKMTWVHWVLYNLPATSTGLPEAVGSQSLPAGTLEGRNDAKRSGYTGPCPPIGRHRYFFKLYALNAKLPNLGLASKADLEKAMEGKILAAAELIGLFQR